MIQLSRAMYQIHQSTPIRDREYNRSKFNRNCIPSRQARQEAPAQAIQTKANAITSDEMDIMLASAIQALEYPIEEISNGMRIVSSITAEISETSPPDPQER